MYIIEMAVAMVSLPPTPAASRLKFGGCVCYCHTHMSAATSATSIVSVRVSESQRAILEAAADLAHTNVSDFVRRKALEAAEIDVLNRSIVTIPAKDWEVFEAWVARPAETIPALAELARRTPTWES